MQSWCVCLGESEAVSCGSGQGPGQLLCAQDPFSFNLDDGSPDSEDRVVHWRLWRAGKKGLGAAAAAAA